MILSIVRVLLVEDNPGDARLLVEALRDMRDAQARADRIDVAVCDTLTSALARAAVDAPDAMLLDLNLPECAGIETFRRVRDASPGVPLVVLSGLDDEALAIQAVREGAQDYLVKGQADGRLVERSIRYAVERHRAEQEHARLMEERAARREAEATLQAERERLERQEAELAALQRLATSGASHVTATAYGAAPLRQGAGADVERLADEYGRVLDLALEQRAYRVAHDLSGELRRLAQRLGVLGAGPRDVVEVHTRGVRRRLEGTTPARGQAYVDESRLLLVELMGHLVSYYRMLPARPSVTRAAS